MGRAISKIKHPFRNFNVENRAHKVISDPVKTSAPKHDRDRVDIERIMREYPKEFEESQKKNEVLDKHLRNVFVTSRDAPLLNEQNQRPLPQDRRPTEPFLFGHKESDSVPVGKVSLRQALQFISKHQSEPTKYTVSFIAQEFKVPEETIKNVLEYFRVFEVYMPITTVNTKAKFAGPSLPKVTIIQHSKKLPAGDPNTNKEDT